MEESIKNRFVSEFLVILTVFPDSGTSTAHPVFLPIVFYFVMEYATNLSFLPFPSFPLITPARGTGLIDGND